MTKATIKGVNKALREAYGEGIEIARGGSYTEGFYFYFYGSLTEGCYSTVIPVPRIGDQTIEQWIEDAAPIIAESSRERAYSESLREQYLTNWGKEEIIIKAGSSPYRA